MDQYESNTYRRNLQQRPFDLENQDIGIDARRFHIKRQADSIHSPLPPFSRKPQRRERSIEENKELWIVYVKEAQDYDKEMIDDMGKDIGALLVFAGLFSAILTAFIVDSYKKLQPDSSETTNALLFALYQGLQAALVNPPLNTHDPLTFDSFVKSQDDPAVAVNALWFGSLFCSLVAALGGMMTRQWLLEYSKGLTRGTPYAQAHERQRRFQGINTWHFSILINSYPLLLQASPILFFAGLCDFLLPFNQTISHFVIGVTSLTAASYIGAIILSLFFKHSPYRTPLSSLLYHAIRHIRDFRWKNIPGPSQLRKAISYWKRDTSDAIDVRAVAWLLTSPKRNVVLTAAEAVPTLNLQDVGTRLLFPAVESLANVLVECFYTDGREEGDRRKSRSLKVDSQDDFIVVCRALHLLLSRHPSPTERRQFLLEQAPGFNDNQDTTWNLHRYGHEAEQPADEWSIKCQLQHLMDHGISVKWPWNTLHRYLATLKTYPDPTVRTVAMSLLILISRDFEWTFNYDELPIEPVIVGLLEGVNRLPAWATQLALRCVRYTDLDEATSNVMEPLLTNLLNIMQAHPSHDVMHTVGGLIMYIAGESFSDDHPGPTDDVHQILQHPSGDQTTGRTRPDVCHRTVTRTINFIIRRAQLRSATTASWGITLDKHWDLLLRSFIRIAHDVIMEFPSTRGHNCQHFLERLVPLLESILRSPSTSIITATLAAITLSSILPDEKFKDYGVLPLNVLHLTLPKVLACLHHPEGSDIDVDEKIILIARLMIECPWSTDELDHPEVPANLIRAITNPQVPLRPGPYWLSSALRLALTPPFSSDVLPMVEAVDILVDLARQPSWPAVFVDDGYLPLLGTIVSSSHIPRLSRIKCARLILQAWQTGERHTERILSSGCLTNIRRHHLGQSFEPAPPPGSSFAVRQSYVVDMAAELLGWCEVVELRLGQRAPPDFKCAIRVATQKAIHSGLYRGRLYKALVSSIGNRV